MIQKSLLLVTLIAIVSSLPDCGKIPDPDGSGMVYDLTSLIGTELTIADSFSTYKTKICQNDYTGCGACEAACCASGTAGYCQNTDFWADCVGKFSTAIGMEGAAGVELLYDNGDWGMVGRIKILCDPAAEQLGNLRPDGDPKTMIVNSKYACLAPANGSGLSLGSILLIVLAGLVIVYIGAGVAWNYFKEEKTGIEVFPNLEFWQSVPSLIKDGAQFTLDKGKELVGK